MNKKKALFSNEMVKKILVKNLDHVLVKSSQQMYKKYRYILINMKLAELR